MPNPQTRLALAPIAGAALAKPAKIAELIEAHRRAHAAFERAIGDMERAEEAYAEAHVDGFDVPSLLGGSCGSRNGLDGCKREIAAGYDNQRRGLLCLSRIAPDLAEQARAVLDAKEIENMALVDRVFAEEAERQERFGLAAAERARDEACDAEEAAALALCSQSCESHDEERLRAEYILSAGAILDDGNGEHFSALLRSFVPAGAGDLVEA